MKTKVETIVEKQKKKGKRAEVYWSKSVVECYECGQPLLTGEMLQKWGDRTHYNNNST